MASGFGGLPADRYPCARPSGLHPPQRETEFSRGIPPNGTLNCGLISDGQVMSKDQPEAFPGMRKSAEVTAGGHDRGHDLLRAAPKWGGPTPGFWSASLCPQASKQTGGQANDRGSFRSAKTHGPGGRQAKSLAGILIDHPSAFLPSRQTCKQPASWKLVCGAAPGA
jgi:hypothetical protein